jgi:HK97 family phage major capsid protein
MSDLNQKLETLGQAWEEFKRTNDERLSAIEQSKATSDFDAKLAKLDSALDAAQKRADEAVKIAQRPGFGSHVADPVELEAKAFTGLPVRRSGPLDVDGYLAYKQAFNGYLRSRGNLDLMSEMHRKTMQAGIDIDGGYLLPPPAQAAILQKVREMSAMREICGSIAISTNAIEGVVDRGDAAAAWVGEVAARPATDTPQLSRDRIETHEIYSFPQMSQQLVEDASVDVEGWMIDRVSTAFAEAEDTAFLAGAGVASPRGLTTYTTAATADATRAWGQLQHVVTGASGAFHTTKADPLLDAVAALKTGYLAGARWLMARATLAAVRKLKEATSDRYLWEPSLQAGVPSTLLGYPVTLDENMPAIAASSLSIAFGDFQRGYLIVDRVGVSVLRDAYTNKPYIGLYVRKRVGGAVRDYDALKLIKFSS